MFSKYKKNIVKTPNSPIAHPNERAELKRLAKRLGELEGKVVIVALREDGWVAAHASMNSGDWPLLFAKPKCFDDMVHSLNAMIRRTTSRKFFGLGLEREYEEGKRLFEFGVEAALQGKFLEAQNLYTSSIEQFPNPAAYLNRGRIKIKRLRYYEALRDFKDAKRYDLEQGCEFISEIENEIVVTLPYLRNYHDGNRENLLDDYDAISSKKYIARRIFCSSFRVEADGYLPYNSPLVEYHFFNDIDNISRFEDLSVYPEVVNYLKEYPSEFIERKVAQEVDMQEYQRAEAMLHYFLCTYDEKRMRILRRYMLHDIHEALLDRDHGAITRCTFDAEPDSHIIREAVEYIKNQGPIS